MVRSSTWSYPSFNLDRDRSPGFGSIPSDYVRPIKTRFRYGSVFDLTLPLKITRWLIMQKARGHPCRKRRRAPTAFKYKVSGSISLLFSRFFSTFPHGTGTLSVSREYLALDDGPPGFKQDFSCPALLRESS